MAEKKRLNGVEVVTPKARASWVFLFRPREAREEGKKPQYTITLLFPKGTDLTNLKKAAVGALTEAWGPKEQWPKNYYTPFKNQGDALRTRDDGSEYLPDGYEEGAFYLEAKTNNKPSVVDQKLNPILEESDFYPGCYCRAAIILKAYDVRGKKGITAYLQHVQKMADGESLSGRSRPEDSFEAIDLPEDEQTSDLGSIESEDTSALGI